MCMYGLTLLIELCKILINTRFYLVEKGNDNLALNTNVPVMEQIVIVEDLAYLTTICLIISPAWQHNRMSKEIFIWFNQVISSDEQLTIKYGQGLKNHPLTKQYKNLLLIITVFASTFTLFLRAFFLLYFFQDLIHFIDSSLKR